MMARTYMNMDETRASLGRDEEGVRQLVREGRLREFRDGPRLMFKAEQVEQLRAEMGMGDQVDLGPSDTGIGLATGEHPGSGSAGGISLHDSGGLGDTASALGNPGMSGTALPALSSAGMSASGLPLVGETRAGGTGLGMRGGMGNPGMSGTAIPMRSGTGINVLGDDAGDPNSQTAVSGTGDSLQLEAMGSGSGLLDLSRERDDTSLGGVLDEIGGSGGRPSPFDSGPSPVVGATTVPVGTPYGTPVAVAPVVVQADSFAPALAGACLAAALFVVVALLSVAEGVAGVSTPVTNLTRDGVATRPLWHLAVAGVVLAAVFFGVGLALGKKR